MQDGTANDIVVTYGPRAPPGPEGHRYWGHYISDTVGIVNLTSPEDACLTEDGTHDFCPDNTSVSEPGAAGNPATRWWKVTDDRRRERLQAGA